MKYKLLFIGHIPLLFPERNVAKQLKIELWLDLSMVLEELELKIIELNMKMLQTHPIDYVI